MRTRAGEESLKHRGDEASRSDGLDSINGGGAGNGGLTETPVFSFGTGRAGREGTDAVSEKTWFEPVIEVSDCPGGVCPVPWAKGVAILANSEFLSSDRNSNFPGENTIEQPPVIQGDVVNHPSHYTDGGGVECIEAIESALTNEEYRGYLKGNIQKYVWREKHKGGTESLKKAQWYLDRLIQLDETQKG